VPTIVTRRSSVLCSAVCATVLAACAADAAEPTGRLAQLDALLTDDPTNAAALAEVRTLNHRADQDFGLIETIELAPGHTLSFYEPAPGRVYLGENRLAIMDSVLDRYGLDQMTAIEAYRVLRPEAELPAALIEATRRRETLAKEAAQAAEPALGTEPSHASTVGFEAPEPGVTVERVDEDVAVVRAQHATSSGTHFRDDGGCPDGNDYEWCLLNYRSNGYVSGTTTRSSWKVAPYTGNVTFSLKVAGDAIGAWTVLQGEFRSFSGESWRCDRPCPICACGWVTGPAGHRGDITNASTTDRFHFGGAFNN
jgi:hypothetical protein